MTGFEEIYKLYFNDVFRFLRGLTANEDLAEELTEESCSPGRLTPYRCLGGKH